MKKNVFIYSVLAILLLMTPSAFAAGGEGVPVKHILIQTLNLSLVVVFLYFALRKKVSAHFKQKHEDFHEFLNRAQKSKEEAEKHQQELKEKIDYLNKTREETIKRAHAEAEALKQKTLREAQTLSEKIEHDARMIAELEISKAKEDLREYLLNESVRLAKETIKEKISQDDHNRLKSDFVSKIEAVR